MTLPVLLSGQEPIVVSVDIPTLEDVADTPGPISFHASAA